MKKMNFENVDHHLILQLFVSLVDSDWPEDDAASALENVRVGNLAIRKLVIVVRPAGLLVDAIENLIGLAIGHTLVVAIVLCGVKVEHGQLKHFSNASALSNDKLGHAHGARLGALWVEHQVVRFKDNLKETRRSESGPFFDQFYLALL